MADTKVRVEARAVVGDGDAYTIVWAREPVAVVVDRGPNDAAAARVRTAFAACSDYLVALEPPARAVYLEFDVDGRRFYAGRGRPPSEEGVSR